MKTETIIPVYRFHDRTGTKADFMIGSNQCNEKKARLDEPHRHDNYTINLLLSGSLTLYLDFDKQTVPAPAVIFIAPGQVHLHDGDGTHDLLSISFSKEYITQDLEDMLACWECVLSNNAITITNEQIQELFTYAKLLFSEYKNNKPQKTLVIKKLLAAFVISCVRIMEKDSRSCKLDTKENNMVRAFRELVDRHYHEKTQVAHYAEMLYVTPGHLNDTIKSLTGRTAKQVIDAKRILEAKRLLYWRKHSVKEIAWQLNFEDDAYFNRYFKKHTGTTPAVYQKRFPDKYN